MRPRVVAPVVAVAVVVAALAGCGGSGSDGSAERGADGGSERSTTTAPVGTGAQAYVGLTKRAAIAKAEAAGVTWRITREDDEEFPVTQDYDPHRLNFEIDDGTVTSATYG